MHLFAILELAEGGCRQVDGDAFSFDRCPVHLASCPPGCVIRVEGRDVENRPNCRSQQVAEGRQVTQLTVDEPVVTAQVEDIQPSLNGRQGLVAGLRGSGSRCRLRITRRRTVIRAQQGRQNAKSQCHQTGQGDDPVGGKATTRFPGNLRGDGVIAGVRTDRLHDGFQGRAHDRLDPGIGMAGVRVGTRPQRLTDGSQTLRLVVVNAIDAHAQGLGDLVV